MWPFVFIVIAGALFLLLIDKNFEEKIFSSIIKKREEPKINWNMEYLGRKRVINVAAEQFMSERETYRIYEKVGEHLNEDLNQCSDVLHAVILYPIIIDNYRKLVESYPHRDGLPVGARERIAGLICEGYSCIVLKAYMTIDLCHVPLIYPYDHTTLTDFGPVGKY